MNVIWLTAGSMGDNYLNVNILTTGYASTLELQFLET